MHYEVVDHPKSNSNATFFEVFDKCQVMHGKELPQVSCSNSGQAFLNSQMSLKITVSNGSDSVDAQRSPPELPVPLLDLFPKRSSIFERFPILQRTQETRCPKVSGECLQQKEIGQMNFRFKGILDV